MKATKSLIRFSVVSIIAIVANLLCSCGNPQPAGSIEDWKKEIIQTEQDFAQMAADSGIRNAFLNYAAEDAVLMRNNSIVSGKNGIGAFFDNQPMDEASISLEWKPDFVDVSASGDLGYTYGKFVFTLTDSSGQKNESTGIFHTVWKRQADGTWRFVWD